MTTYLFNIRFTRADENHAYEYEIGFNAYGTGVTDVASAEAQVRRRNDHLTLISVKFVAALTEDGDQLLWAHDFIGTDRNPNTKGSGRTATAIRLADGSVRVKIIGEPFLTNDPMIVISDAVFTAAQFEQYEEIMLIGMGVKEAR